MASMGYSIVQQSSIFSTASTGLGGSRQQWLRGSTYTLWKKVAILKDTAPQQPQEVRQTVLAIPNCTRQPEQATAGPGGERGLSTLRCVQARSLSCQLSRFQRWSNSPQR